jgi:uncharacterized protein YdhG (YjbR/CyaY superfamily)
MPQDRRGKVPRMATEATPGSIDEYIAGFPPETRRRLEETRAIVREAAPDATETISYAMPTFDLGGRHLVHFAGYKEHIGFYPVPGGDVPFRAELEPYWNGRGTARLPLSQPLPADLIRKIVEFWVDANTRGGRR